MSRTRSFWSVLLTLLAVLAISVPIVNAQDSSPEAQLPQVPQFLVGGSDQPDSSNQTMGDFVRTVYTDVNTFWTYIFGEAQLPYVGANWLAVEATWKYRSNCPGGSNDGYSWVGDPAEDTDGTQHLSPAFYCPTGGTYLDNQVLSTPIVYLSAPWLNSNFAQVNPDNYDFAVASVIAHELGHHVQFELGQVTVENGNPGYCCGLDSRQLELSADCFGGVWANSAYNAGELTDTDVEEAQSAGLMSGGDFPLLPGTPGDHGTGVDRSTYWTTGYNTGDPGQCNPLNITP